MIETLETMYDGYGFDNVVGISYFNKFLDKLRSYRFSEIFAFQAKRYPLRYVFDFLLSTPSLWDHLSDLEWIEIMKSMNPRPDPLKLSLDSGYFADICFLAKYIRVNSIEVFLQQASFSDLDKNCVIRYCRKDIYSLFIDDIDREDLDDDYFMSEQEIRTVQSRLTSGSVFSDFSFNEDELINYLKLEQIFLNLLQQGGKITLIDFALSTQIFIEEAQTYLDQKAKQLNADVETNDEGQIIYRFPK